MDAYCIARCMTVVIVGKGDRPGLVHQAHLSQLDPSLAFRDATHRQDAGEIRLS